MQPAELRSNDLSETDSRTETCEPKKVIMQSGWKTKTAALPAVCFGLAKYWSTHRAEALLRDAVKEVFWMKSICLVFIRQVHARKANRQLVGTLRRGLKSTSLAMRAPATEPGRHGPAPSHWHEFCWFHWNGKTCFCSQHCCYQP